MANIDPGFLNFFEPGSPEYWQVAAYLLAKAKQSYTPQNPNPAAWMGLMDVNKNNPLLTFNTSPTGRVSVTNPVPPTIPGQLWDQYLRAMKPQPGVFNRTNSNTAPVPPVRNPGGESDVAANPRPGAQPNAPRMVKGMLSQPPSNNYVANSAAWSPDVPQRTPTPFAPTPKGLLSVG